MIYRFPAVFEQDKEDEKYINVVFPDLLGVVTFGEGMEDAVNMAKDVLLTMLEYDYIRNSNASTLEQTKSNFPGKQVLMVEVDYNG